MGTSATWITGTVRSGKTEALLEHLAAWVQGESVEAQTLLTESTVRSPSEGVVLLFAANADNRTQLLQRASDRLKGLVRLQSTTPLAFFESEVLLFWPLVIERLNLRGYFPVRLRPETEQALALKLWAQDDIARLQCFEAGSADQWVRRLLDLLQLASASGTPLTQIADLLVRSEMDPVLPADLAALVQVLLLKWQAWCLGHGLLTYGLVMDLFWQYVLPHPTYQRQFGQRFKLIAADDTDNYPAIAKLLFEQSLKLGVPGIFTFSELGGIREGLGADPRYFAGLKERCTLVELPLPLDVASLGPCSFPELTAILQPTFAAGQPMIYSLQETSRIRLLQAIAQEVHTAIAVQGIRPQDIAIVGPGLDPIARYTLIDGLQHLGIAVQSIHDQRPIQSAAVVRALLALLALVYPGLGHLLDVEQVAEMLVVLTAAGPTENGLTLPHSIDPIRAGLLADYCFKPHPQHPELLPIEAYERWDRIGHNAAQAYGRIRNWIAQQQGQLGISTTASPGGTAIAYLTLNPVFILDRAIQTFITHRPLALDQLSILRELIETAQHFWDIDARLRKTDVQWSTLTETIADFIGLLRRGVITANPYPTSLDRQIRPAVTLATTFQYLNARLSHPWQFWLDAGSQLWQYSGAVDLWGAALFLKSQTPVQDRTDPENRDLRFCNTLLELLGRVQDRIYLCYSELSTNGQPQMGPLTAWVDLAQPLLVEPNM
ncbi:MAG TPA: recombinase family protein [Stenomitos sp.]